MKAISLTQPWASAVVLGSKRVETRGWSTSYCGPLAIHAAKGFGSKTGLDLLCASSEWCGALRRDASNVVDAPWIDLPLGAIIGTVELVDCRPTGTFTSGELDTWRVGPLGGGFVWTERQLGNFDVYDDPETKRRPRFGFVLERVRQLATPIPCRGALGLWAVPAVLEQQIREAA